MRIRPLLLLAILSLPLGGGASTPVPASTGSTRVAFAAEEWKDVGLDVHGVTVDRLRLHPPGGVRGLLTRHDTANRGSVVVTNHGDRHVTPAVAVAVFDEEGRLLAATNTGGRARSIPPGRTIEMDIHLGGVFRHLERGRWIYISLEY